MNACLLTDLYEEALQPLMDSFLQGFNVTVIAYGQTGSGKTFTMGNSIAASAMIASRLFFHPTAAAAKGDEGIPPPVDTIQESEGLIPRFLHQLFAQLNGADSADGHQVSVSFLEIYGEEIHDLLSDHARANQDEGSQSLQLRESKSGVWVQGLTEVYIYFRASMSQIRENYGANVKKRMRFVRSKSRTEKMRWNRCDSALCAV